MAVSPAAVGVVHTAAFSCQGRRQRNVVNTHPVQLPWQLVREEAETWRAAAAGTHPAQRRQVHCVACTPCLHPLLALPEHLNTPLQPHLVVLAQHLAHQRLSGNLCGRHVPPRLDHGFGAGEAAALHHKLLGVRQGVRLRGQEEQRS